VAVTVQRLHRRRVSTSERLRHRYQRNGQVLFVPAHPRVPARFTVTYAVVREQHHYRVLEGPGVVQRPKEPSKKLVHVWSIVHVIVKQTGKESEGKYWTSVGSVFRFAIGHLHHISHL